MKKRKQQHQENKKQTKRFKFDELGMCLHLMWRNNAAKLRQTTNRISTTAKTTEKVINIHWVLMLVNALFRGVMHTYF